MAGGATVKGPSQNIFLCKKTLGSCGINLLILDSVNSQKHNFLMYSSQYIAIVCLVIRLAWRLTLYHCVLTISTDFKISEVNGC